MRRQLFCMLLVLVMVIGLVPVRVFASETGSAQSESYGDFIDGEQVIRDMIEQNGMYAHPRIICSAVTS